MTVEKPIHVKITGAIDLDSLSLAVSEGKKDLATVVGKGTHKHSLERSKKYTFPSGDFEMYDYKQEAECELDILYIANPARIKLSSNHSFEVLNIGTETSSYGGIEHAGEYRKSESMSLYLGFLLERSFPQ